MKEINLTTEELKDSLKGNYIDSGSEESVYLHNNNDKKQNVFMAKDYMIEILKTYILQQPEKKLENKEKKNL